MSQRTPRRKRTPDTTKKRRGRVAAAACALAALALLAGTAAVAWAPAAAIATVAGTAQGDATLAGAVFKVTFTPGGAPAPTHTWYLDSVESGGQGKVVLDDAHLSQHPDYKGKSSAVPKKDGKVFLQYGDYTLEEVVAPVGYQLWQGKQTVSFATGTKVEFKDVEDKVVLGGLSGVKLDAKAADEGADSHPPLSGGEFTVYNRSAKSVWVDGKEVPVGGAACVAVTDADGRWETGLKLPYGTYEVKETKAPDGYALDPNWTSGLVKVPARTDAGAVTSHVVDAGACANEPKFYSVEGWKDDSETGGASDMWPAQAVSLTSNISGIATGSYGNLYQVYAVDKDGKLWATGQNGNGDMGIGVKQSTWTLPTSQWVPMLGIEGRVKQVASSNLGSNGTSAAVTEEGLLYVWGENKMGQLGLGDQTLRLSPVLIDPQTFGGARIVDVDVTATAPNTATTASAETHGRGQVVAVDELGRVWMAGNNKYGTFGDGSSNNIYKEFRQVGAGKFDGKAVKAALCERGTVAVLTEKGSIYTAGANNIGSDQTAGLLGSGSMTPATRPSFAKVTGSATFTDVDGAVSSFKAVDSAGNVWGWGHLYSGEAGNGNTVQFAATPVKASVSNVAQLCTSGNQAVAVTRSGELYAWGNNGGSVYGDGTTTTVATPKRVLTGVKNVVMGSSHMTMVEMTDGTYRWTGHNSSVSIPGPKSTSWTAMPLWRDAALMVGAPSAQGDASLAGAVYGVFSDKGCTNKVAEATTGEDGHWRTSRCLVNGTYWVKEIKAPACGHYDLDPAVRQFKVDGADVCVTPRPQAVSGSPAAWSGSGWGSWARMDGVGWSVRDTQVSAKVALVGQTVSVRPELTGDTETAKADSFLLVALKGVADWAPHVDDGHLGSTLCDKAGIPNGSYIKIRAQGGEASWVPTEPGVYTLVCQIGDKTKGGKSVDSGTVQVVVVDPGTEGSYVTDNVHHGAISGTKVDDKGKALAGATFNVYNLSANPVMVDRDGDGTHETRVEVGGLCMTTAASDANGRWTTGARALPVGTYRVEEASAPESHLKSSWSCVVSITKDGQTVTAPGDGNGGPWVNVAFKGGVAGLKVDAELSGQGTAQGSATLAGAEFQVFSWTASGNNAVLERKATVTTAADGTWKAEGLAAGNYVAVETKAPAGYALPDHKVSLGASAKHTLAVGKAPTAELVEAAVGGTARAFRIASDGQAVTLFSRPVEDQVGRGGISGAKTDAATGSKAQGSLSLGGAEFTVHNQNANPVVVDTTGDGKGDTEVRGKLASESVGPVCLTVTTSADGSWSTAPEALPAGTYLVKESKAPAGYRLNASWSATVTVAAGKVAAVAACPDTAETSGGTASVKAFAHKGGQGAASLAGAEFAVRNVSAGPVSWKGEVAQPGAEFSRRLVTDAKGQVTFEALPECTLELREVKAPAGLTVNGAWRGTYKVSASGVAALSAPCPDEGSLHALAVKKVDADGGAPLEGAVFELYYASDAPASDGERSWSKGDHMASAVTGADGLARFEGLPYADYVVAEAEAPEGYELAGPVTVRAADLDRAVSVTVEDVRARGDLELVKVDENGAPMAGVPFRIDRVDPETGAVIERHLAVTRPDGRLDTAGRAPKNVNGNDRLLKADGTIERDAALDASATVWFGPGTPAATGALEVGSYVVTELAHRSNDGKQLVSMEREITPSWPTLDLDTVENRPVSVETSAHDEASAAVQVVFDFGGRQIVDEVWVDGFDGEWGDRDEEGTGELSWSLETRLMSVATGKVAVRADGTECVQRQRAVYTDEGAPQRVEISMEGLEPGSYVVFQRVIDADGRVVGSHEDWGAAEQTVTVARASCETSAGPASGPGEAVMGVNGATVTDLVKVELSFPTEWMARGLVADRGAYLAAVAERGEAAVRAEAERAMDDPDSQLPSWALGRAESEWVWTDAAGGSEATVTFRGLRLFPLVGSDVVCFETVYREAGADDGSLQPIARHIDPDAPSQVLEVAQPLSHLPSSGLPVPVWALASGAVAVAAACLWAARRARGGRE